MIQLLKHFLWWIGLVGMQVFILDNTHFFGLFLPLIYVYALLKWPSDFSPAATVICGFLLGLSVDVLSNTPGMHAASTTFIAFLRYYVLRLFISKVDLDDRDVGIVSLGVSNFWKYAILLVVLHHSITFILESFSFENSLQLLLKIPVCSLFTLLFVGAFERINRHQDARI
jgi:rod shape-determining protein MreD